MVPRRLTFSLLVAALVLGPAIATAGVPVGMYPFRVPGLSAAQRTELHGILDAALAAMSRRGILSSRSPVLLPVTCGESPTPACLAEAAKGGLVFAGRGELKGGGVVLVTAAMWDARGGRTREVRFVVDLVIQNLRPIGDALMELEMEIEPDGHVAGQIRPPAARDPHGPPAATPPSLAAAPPPAPSEHPASRAAAPKPVAAARLQTAAAERGAPPLWKRRAGPWLTGIGVALLAGGAAVGYVNRNLADDHDARYARGELGGADRSSYDRVKTYNVLSTALFAAGGTSIAAGTWIWISAPAAPGRPAVVGAGGRF